MKTEMNLTQRQQTWTWKIGQRPDLPEPVVPCRTHAAKTLDTNV